MGQPLSHDSTIAIRSFLQGFRIDCDQVIKSAVSRPNCFITLDVPHPLASADHSFWSKKAGYFGYQPLILDAVVTSEGRSIFWTPRKPTSEGLIPQLAQMIVEMDLRDTPLLLRLTLKGNFIWCNGDNKVLYLDGEAFADTAKKIDYHLLLSGNGQRGSDFEMWFWITLLAPG